MNKEIHFFSRTKKNSTLLVQIYKYFMSMFAKNLTMIDNNKNITYISNSIKGEKRSKNQDDTLFINEDNYYLFFLFDGVSSSEYSYDFIQVCKRYINNNHHKYFTKEVKLDELLFDTHCYSIKEFDKKVGFSTCSAIFLNKKNLVSYFFNIGDSRIYEYSNQYLEQITRDDNLPGNSNYLTKSLGSSEIKKEDFKQEKINLNYGFLICSDGFYSLLERNKSLYFSILHFKKPQNIINSLKRIQTGINNDDSTFIIIRKNGI